MAIEIPDDPAAARAALNAIRAEMEQALKMREAEESLAEFVKQAWHVLEPAEPLLWNWHLDVLCVYLQAWYDGVFQRGIANVPPGTMKTLLVNVMAPAWRWVHKPSERFLTMTNSAALATDTSVKMRRIILSDWYQGNWGSRFDLSRDQAEKVHFNNSKTGSRQSLGFESDITGRRVNRIIIDDSIDMKRALSDVEMASVRVKYDHAVSSRLGNPRRDGVFLIEQRSRTNDLTGHLLSKKAQTWVHLRIPMEYELETGYDILRDLGEAYAKLVPKAILTDPRTQRGDLLWPERFTREEVERLKEDLGPFSSGQLQQRPVPAVGGILRKGDWRIWGEDGWTVGRKLPLIKHAFCSWDTAFSAEDRKLAAYSAMTAVSYTHLTLPTKRIV